MKTRYGIVVATMIASLALSGPAFAAGGQGKGQAVQKETKSINQKQQRLQDGSGTQTGTLGEKNKSGKAYGPGDGSGNQGQGPKDGTGYGAPANR